MDKNNIDIDFDFEKEYGFDPKDLLDDADDFDFSEFLDEDLDENPSIEEENASAGDYMTEEATQSIPLAEEEEEESGFETPVDERTRVFPSVSEDDLSSEESFEAETPDEFYEEELEEDDGEEPDGKKKNGMKLPKLPKLPVRKKKTDPNAPAKKSAFSKLLDVYMEPVTRMHSEAAAMDPLDPKYVRRKARQKKRIFKEVYLPAIIGCVALFLLLSFVVGAVSNMITRNKNQSAADKLAAQDQVNAAAKSELEFKRVIAEAEQLAVTYDYDKAIELLENYSGKSTPFEQQVVAKKAELLSEKDQLLEWKDVSTIPNLSFHVLMADASRACNKEVSGAELSGQYNKNFVSVEEFSRILNQLYAANYVLVDFNSFISSNTGVDGNQSFFTQPMYLPKGKCPIMLTETMVNYFEYMVDPDKDGTLDKNGHGFANKLVLDSNGDIKASYVDETGQTLIGNYDFVPVLEAFIQEHPDFSYRGARAILAVTGTEGVFGYRTNTSYVSRFGQAFYDDQVADAKKIVEALRQKGYTIASYTYSNQAYRGMSTVQIQAELQNWNNQITPVLGDVDTIVFARGSDIEAYSGTTFNVLYNSGLRFFLNSGSSPRVDANTTFVRQTRLMVTGEAMAHYSSQFSDYFDSNVILDITSRGSYPVKS